MIIPRKDKPYFYPPFFDISCFWQESTGLSHKIRVYIPFETTMTFTPFLGVMVNRKQFEYFTIEDNPMRKPNAKLLSDEDAESVIAWIKLNCVALLQHWYGHPLLQFEENLKKNHFNLLHSSSSAARELCLIFPYR